MSANTLKEDLVKLVNTTRFKVFSIVSILILCFLSFFLSPFDFTKQINKKIYDLVGDPIANSCLFQSRSSPHTYNSTCFIDKKSLQAKISKGLPNWAIEQIREDLSKFSIISTADLDKYYQQYNTPINVMARFKIENGEVNVISPMPANNSDDAKTKALNVLVNNVHKGAIHHPRVISMYTMFEYLAKNKFIKDTDFIVVLYDYANIPKNEIFPFFTFAKDIANPNSAFNSAEKDLILIPDWLNLSSATYLRPLIRHANTLYHWEDKKNILFWRGGIFDSTGFRKKLVELSDKYPELIDAKFVYQDYSEYQVPEEAHLQYKYLISIDGARASWERLIWHLHSNSLVFKHDSSQLQWFYKGIKPYVHYVPVKDEEDLFKKIAWAEVHPDEVRKIIQNSTTFTEENLTLEDMYHYYIVLLEEYNKKFKK